MKRDVTSFSEDPVKNRVIRNIINSRTQEQFNNSKRYAELAGMLEDNTIKEWIKFKESITPFNSPF